MLGSQQRLVLIVRLIVVTCEFPQSSAKHAWGMKLYRQVQPDAPAVTVEPAIACTDRRVHTVI